MKNSEFENKIFLMKKSALAISTKNKTILNQASVFFRYNSISRLLARFSDCFIWDIECASIFSHPDQGPSHTGCSRRTAVLFFTAMTTTEKSYCAFEALATAVEINGNFSTELTEKSNSPSSSLNSYFFIR